MKFVWEASDIRAGLQVLSYNRASEFIIGYDPSVKDSKDNWCLIDLADGMVFASKSSKADMLSILNDTKMDAFLRVDGPAGTYGYLPRLTEDGETRHNR